MSRKPNLEAREKILQAACGLLHQHGLKGISMDDVAAGAGMKKANLFHYYPSKEELALAVLDYICAASQSRILERFRKSGDDPVSAVQAMFDDHIRRMRENKCCRGCLIGNLAQELSDHSEKLRGKLAEHFRFWAAQLAWALERGKAAGRFAGGFQPQQAAEAILSTLEGAVLLSKTSRQVSALESARRMALEYLKAHARRK